MFYLHENGIFRYGRIKNKAMIQLNKIRLNNCFIGYDGKPLRWEIGHFKCLLDGTSGLELDELYENR